MELKLAGGRLRIHLLLIPVCGGMLYLGGGMRFLAFGAALFLHELFHLFMASALGVQVLSMELLPFGCAANLGGMEYTAKGKEVMIAAAGPAASLMIAAACRAFPWEGADFGELFYRSNLALGAMNLMPVYPLDGGRISSVLLRMFLPGGTVRCVSAALGVLLSAGICILGFTEWGGISFWIMGGFMLLSAVKGFRAEELGIMTSAAMKQKAFSKKRSMDVRNIACGSGRTLGEVYVSLDQRKYNIVYVVDGEMRVREIVDEGMLMKRIINEGSGAKLLTKKEPEQRMLRFPK